MSEEQQTRDVRRIPWVRLVAEFGVIFLGVTLSLLADDWRQSRTDRADERMALEELLADLEADSADMGGLRGGAEGDAKAALWIYQGLGENDVDPDSLSANLRTIYNWYVYSATRATYAGLRSTGRLTLIQDDQLRRKVTTYYEERQPLITGFYETSGDVWRTLREAFARDVEWNLGERAETFSSGAAYIRMRLKRPWSEMPTDPLLRHHLEIFGILAEVIAMTSAQVLGENADLRASIQHALSK